MVQTCSLNLNRTNEKNNFVLLVVSNVIINFSAGFLLLCGEKYDDNGHCQKIKTIYSTFQNNLSALRFIWYVGNLYKQKEFLLTKKKYIYILFFSYNTCQNPQKANF